MSSWDPIPQDIKLHGRLTLRFHPYFFNVGINEQQTLAENLQIRLMGMTVPLGGVALVLSKSRLAVRNGLTNFVSVMLTLFRS
ncbi:unnamed protein product [Protopolystoma xenopodis]|uniref:Uncharacterized protein n=1 Tax=Protopolystoma xenopodis TaxID=117903 RepID=A0A448WF66_9PLAT|nr:unnamed protein product [Protopolystoma xenopodis]